MSNDLGVLFLRGVGVPSIQSSNDDVDDAELGVLFLCGLGVPSAQASTSNNEFDDTGVSTAQSSIAARLGDGVMGTRRFKVRINFPILFGLFLM
jgi:hypothetical protein